MGNIVKQIFLNISSFNSIFNISKLEPWIKTHRKVGHCAMKVFKIMFSLQNKSFQAKSMGII